MATTTYIGYCVKIKKTDLSKFKLKDSFYEIPNEDYAFDSDYSHIIPNTNTVGKEIDYGFTDLSEESILTIKESSILYFYDLVSKLNKLNIDHEFIFGIFMYAY